jgi:Na+-translocating ferredoxin:NAD+ oxidoreductase RnfD subunit
MTTTIQLKKRIMRRVYYTFGIRLATHVTTLHLVVMAAAVYALGYFVHVAAVFRNASSVPVGEFIHYVLQALAQADVMTLLVLGVIVLTAISLPFSVPHHHRMRIA